MWATPGSIEENVLNVLKQNIPNEMNIERNLKVDSFLNFLALKTNVWLPKIIFTSKNLLKAIILIFETDVKINIQVN